MKRLMTVSVAFIFTMIILVGCSPMDSIASIVSKQAEGVIAYGDAAVVESDVKSYQDDLKSSNLYPIKMADDVMLLKSSTAKALFDQGLLRKVVGESKTEVLSTLPAVTADTGVLFAKQSVHPLLVGGKEVNAKYDGNVVIGNGRNYAEMFLVLDDEAWEKASGEEKMMGVLHFDKKNPKHELTNFSSERVQLVDMR